MHLLLKAKTREQFRSTRRRCVATDVFQMCVVMREDFTVFDHILVRVVGFRSKRGLRLTQLNVPVQRVFQCGAIRRRRLLRDMRNDPAVGH